MVRIVLISVLLLVLAAPALAQSSSSGIGAYLRGDYAAALEIWRPLAEGGDARAQFKVGVLYYKGQGVPLDQVEAIRWYRLAAELGDIFAQFNLGFMYEEGQGVTQDYVQSHRWFAAAAAQGDEEAGENRDLVAAKMTSAQVAEAQRLASEWAATHPRK